MKRNKSFLLLIVLVTASMVGCGRRTQQGQVVDKHHLQERAFVEVARENFTLPDVAKEMVNSKVTEVVCTFAFDASELSTTDEKQLNEAFANVEPGTLHRVEIEGHCCNIGEDSWNDSLSQLRAEVVAEYIERQHDVPRDKMVTLAFGEARPKHPNDTQSGRSANRRCEVVIVHSGKGGLAD